MTLLFALSGCRYIKGDPKVAFLGDSLTQKWFYPEANFGIFGNTTEQILNRTPAVIDGRRYAKVILLGGTNDVLLHIDPTVTIGNLETIATQIQKAGEEPVLCEIPPIFHNFNLKDKTDFSEPVKALNEQIAQLAVRHGWKLVDYYDPMLGHPGYSSDGVHMKKLGYLTMERALLKVVPDA
ncbi:SGNH/GDSL hydrolase family protein [Acidicapsa dinghuensis]|uniref:SGNH/GDSL hydrolase family protein n=1 Tax=Acidicapsa dinghuensis TaxID=2218256 RepID=A0ABW1ELQ5_9BACT|nr:GDSL-type esterase/lipase family protein [Acidicapsa dinghuensis]